MASHHPRSWRPIKRALAETAERTPRLQRLAIALCVAMQLRGFRLKRRASSLQRKLFGVDEGFTEVLTLALLGLALSLLAMERYPDLAAIIAHVPGP
ncbi:MAG TPA: hypothetical protein VFA12_18690 [Stellaceae bacterium]|nr:hypothetical protein [Stellaceae bacterium]